MFGLTKTDKIKKIDQKKISFYNCHRSLFLYAGSQICLSVHIRIRLGRKEIKSCKSNLHFTRASFGNGSKCLGGLDLFDRHLLLPKNNKFFLPDRI